MLTRIVKMSFKAEHCLQFENLFSEIRKKIESQPGCSGVNLLKDMSAPGTYFTVSRWDSEKSLNAYRSTDLFGKVWPTVKSWMTERAEAWSTAEVANS